MSDRIQQSVGALEEIKKGLREKEEQKGAYYCSFPSFIDIYHVISRMMERSGISVYIMLCTLTDKNGEIRMGTDPEQGGFGGLKSCDLQFSQARRFLHQIQRKPVSGHAFRDDSGELPGALGQN